MKINEIATILLYNKTKARIKIKKAKNREFWFSVRENLKCKIFSVKDILRNDWEIIEEIIELSND